MKKLFFLFSTFLIFSLEAKETKIKDYLSVRCGPSWPHLVRMKILNSPLPEKIAKKSDTDLNLLYGLAFGISYEEKKLPFYFEVEYIGHSKATFFVKSEIEQQNPIFLINKISIENQGVFGNAYYKIKVHDRLSPYLNMGFGFSYNKTKVVQKEFGSEISYNLQSKKCRFAWNMGAGLISRIYKKLYGEIGYRYSDLNITDPKAHSSPFGNIKARIVRNEVIVSLRCEF